jgi:type VI secretion system secreted protein Hcp
VGFGTSIDGLSTNTVSTKEFFMAAYLKYDAIKKGESLAKGHEGDKGWIEIGSIQFGVGRGISTPVGSSSKREASEPTVSELMLSKLLDGTSPLFFQEALTGAACKAQIDLVETSANQLETYLEITLTNAMISGYSVSSGGSRPSENITLNFTKIEYKYTPYSDDHKPKASVSSTYDLTSAEHK